MPKLFQMFQFRAIGHSAAANICIGFKPRWILLYNETTLSEAGLGLWGYSDGNGDGMKVVNSAATQLVMETTNGFSQYNGGDEPDGTDAYQDGEGTALTIYSTSGKLTAEGFTIGTAVSADSDAINGIAFG